MTSRRSFKWRKVAEWNDLSMELRSELNFLKFKRELRREIIRRRPEVTPNNHPTEWE